VSGHALHARVNIGFYLAVAPKPAVVSTVPGASAVPYGLTTDFFFALLSCIRYGHSFNQFEFDSLLGNTDLPVGTAQIIYMALDSAGATAAAGVTEGSAHAIALGAPLMAELRRSWLRLDYNEFAGGDGVDRQEEVVVVHAFHPIKHHLQRLYDGDISGGMPPRIRREKQFYFYAHGSDSADRGRKERQCSEVHRCEGIDAELGSVVKVPIFLGHNASYNQELDAQVRWGDDVHEVARQFCVEHGIAPAMQQAVADLINTASGHNKERPKETIADWLGGQQHERYERRQRGDGKLFMLIDGENDNIVPAQVGPNGERMGGPNIHMAVSAETLISADVQVCLGDRNGHICTPLNNDLMHRTESHLTALGTRTMHGASGVLTSNSSAANGVNAKPNKYAVSNGVTIGWAPGSLLRGPGNRVALRVIDLGGFLPGPHRLWFWLMDGAAGGAADGARNVTDKIGFRFHVRNP
jgi:hypothetical protein